MGQVIDACNCNCMRDEHGENRFTDTANISTENRQSISLDDRYTTVVTVLRGYIARQKIITGLKRLTTGKLSKAPFPPMTAKAQNQFDKLGAYYGSTKDKSGYQLPDNSVYIGDWDH